MSVVFWVPFLLNNVSPKYTFAQDILFGCTWKCNKGTSLLIGFSKLNAKREIARFFFDWSEVEVASKDSDQGTKAFFLPSRFPNTTFRPLAGTEKRFSYRGSEAKDEKNFFGQL